MRSGKPSHLADLDPQRAAEEVTWEVYSRAKRDLPRLGFVLSFPTPTPTAAEPKTPTVGTVLGQSKIHKLV